MALGEREERQIHSARWLGEDVVGLYQGFWCIWLAFQPRRFTIAPSAVGCKRLLGTAIPKLRDVAPGKDVPNILPFHVLGPLPPLSSIRPRLDQKEERPQDEPDTQRNPPRMR